MKEIMEVMIGIDCEERIDLILKGTL